MSRLGIKKIILRRACPICGHNEGINVRTLQFALYDSYPIERTVFFVSCTKCGAFFYDSSSTQEDYEKYYQIHEYYATVLSSGNGGDTPVDKHRFQNYINIIRKHSSTESTGIIADIGCAQGGFLRILKEQRYSNLVGIDPLRTNINFIKSNICNAKIGSATMIPIEDSSCRYIFLTHVLEHVWELPQAMQEIRRVLADNGIAYIEVPNILKYPSNSNVPIYDFFYEHINHFDQNSLKSLFAIHGFECLEMGTKSFDDKTDSPEYCLYSVIKLGKASPPILAPPSSEIMSQIYDLFTVSKSISNFLKFIQRTKSPIHIWGLSSYMLYLLETHIFPNISVTGLYDSDESKQKQTINGIKIESPEKLFKLSSKNTIVIPEGPYAKQLAQILQAKNFKGKLFVL